MADTHDIDLELESADAAADGGASGGGASGGGASGGDASGGSTVVRESGVLVVEDDPDMQWRLARMLTVHGARVVGTSSGEAALALIEQWPADLVLVDQGLPGISGIEVARRIRQKHPEIPVVLMSAEESTDLRLAAKVAGAVEMLIKPFRVEIVSEMLQRLKLAGTAALDRLEGLGRLDGAGAASGLAGGALAAGADEADLAPAE